MEKSLAPFSSSKPFQLVDRAGLRAQAAAERRWLWHGYLAPGRTTLLTAQWKTGKTTLLSVLLSRMKEGGALAGLPVAPGKALIVSEEYNSDWDARCDRFDLSGHVRWLCKPFLGKPKWDSWQTLLEYLAEERSEFAYDLLVFDSLGSLFPPGVELNADLMGEAMGGVQRLAALGAAVGIMHHPAKHASPDGMLARGTGALSALVDILMEMYPYAPGSDSDRRRRLQAFSRSEATARQLVIELNEAGTDYLCRGDLETVEFHNNWYLLHGILAAARCKLSVRDIEERWPRDEDKPHNRTLGRWLERARVLGRVNQQGQGTKPDPHLWWLVGQEKEWNLDAVALMELEQQEARRTLAKVIPGVAEDEERRARQRLRRA
jgi:hypothetical protein